MLNYESVSDIRKFYIRHLLDAPLNQVIPVFIEDHRL
jgi:hypothetical protein